jgi:hypothetical protein
MLRALAIVLTFGLLAPLAAAARQTGWYLVVGGRPEGPYPSVEACMRAAAMRHRAKVGQCRYIKEERSQRRTKPPAR